MSAGLGMMVTEVFNCTVCSYLSICYVIQMQVLKSIFSHMNDSQLMSLFENVSVYGPHRELSDG